MDYQHPVVLAKELATIDLLSDGRLEVGLGAGWVAAEYEGLGITQDRPGVRIERLKETVGLCGSSGAASRSTCAARTSGPWASPAGRGPSSNRAWFLIGGGAPRVLRAAGELADIVSINFNNAAGKLGSNSVESYEIRHVIYVTIRQATSRILAPDQWRRAPNKGASP